MVSGSGFSKSMICRKIPYVATINSGDMVGRGYLTNLVAPNFSSRRNSHVSIYAEGNILYIHIAHTHTHTHKHTYTHTH